MTDVSIGVAGALGPEVIGRLAPVVERCGFGALWVNDTPGGDSLAALAAAADATSRLGLATGVIPLDRRGADEIVAAVHRLELPEARLVLGVGAGRAGKGALSLVSDAVDTLRNGTLARVLVGGLGPKMRELGVRQADGVLLNWLTPGAAHEQAQTAHAGGAEGAADTGAPAAAAPGSRAPHVALYVRTALDQAADARLAKEAHGYAAAPAYAANFARLGIRADDTVLAADTFDGRVGEYLEAVDEVVLRVIVPTDSLHDHVRFIESAAERLRLAS